MKSQPTKLATTATTMMMATTIIHGPRPGARVVGEGVLQVGGALVALPRLVLGRAHLREVLARPALPRLLHPRRSHGRHPSLREPRPNVKKGVEKTRDRGRPPVHWRRDDRQRVRNAGNIGIVWLSTQDAAKRLGVTPRTLYRFIDEGQLAAYRFGRVIRLQLAEVDEFIERCRIQPGSLEHLYPESVASVGGSADD